MHQTNLKELLDSEAERINSKEFIADDPVQFPRRFTKQDDIEAVALLSSTIAWGNRKMICRDNDRLLALMADDPANFIREGAFEKIDDELNIHRTFFGRNLKHWCRTLSLIFLRYETVENLGKAFGFDKSEIPAWELAKALLAIMDEANGGVVDSRCLPLNIEKSALKRLNMALRWLVRDDGIVDIGIWKALKPSQLYIPLDIHVSRVSRELGLITRKSNDFKAVKELTEACRRFRPDDPAVYDFALFGIGMKI